MTWHDTNNKYFINVGEFEFENHGIREEYRDNLACSFPETEPKATRNLS